MSFYAKACFVIAAIALIGAPLSWFVISRQLANAVDMDFEVLRTDTEFVSVERRTVGRVFLKGTHPERGEIETQAQVDPETLGEYPAGKRLPGKFYQTEKEHYAHIGPAAEATPFGPTPMFLGIAVFFGLLGVFLVKRGGA